MPSQFKNYIYLLVISLIWGSQFIFNTLALETLPPFFIATARSIIGALTLILFLGIFKGKLRNKNHYNFGYLIRIFIIGIFETTLPLMLLTWGQTGTSSGIAAILIGTAPIFTAIMVALFVKSEKVHLGTLLSIIFGFGGLIILFFPELTGSLDSILSHLEKEIAILAAAFAFALSLVLMRTLPVKSPTYAARDILIAASIQLILFWVISGESFPSKEDFTIASISSLLILGVFCAGIVYFLYMKLIKLAGATFTAITNYLVPLIGVILGVIFLGESTSIREIIALCIIILGIVANELLGKKHNAS